MYDNYRKILILLLILTFIFSLFTLFISSDNSISISAKSAALYEPQTQKFVYTKNASQRLGMASTTKIMTALIALERLDNNETFEIDSRAVGIEGSSIYLKAGERMNTLDLVYSLLLQSANDAAAALAYKIAGSIEEFASLMNERASEMNLKNTNFQNPHGLDDKNHYTTAEDLALLTAEALKNDTFKQIASSYKKVVETNYTKRTLVNHNKLLKSYDGCIGVKTGYTKKCGRCLVSAAERDGLTLISVTINAPDDWRDHAEMLDYGYSLLEARNVASIGDFSYDIPVLNGEIDYVRISNKDSFKFICNKNDYEITAAPKLSRYFSAPVKAGDILGEVIFTKNGIEIGRIPLTADNSVETVKRKHKFSDRLRMAK